MELKVHVADGENEWVNTFTEVIEALLAIAKPSVSLCSDSDTIEEMLLDIKNIKFVYNVKNKVMVKVLNVSL